MADFELVATTRSARRFSDRVLRIFIAATRRIALCICGGETFCHA
jgi:hypothetical protein